MCACMCMHVDVHVCVFKHFSLCKYLYGRVYLCLCEFVSVH